MKKYVLLALCPFVIPVSVAMAGNTSLPKVVEVKAPAEVNAGETFQLQVKIVDEGPGLRPEHIQNFNSSFRWEKNSQIGIDVSHPAKLVGGSWFSYEVKVSQYRPSGKYTLNGCIYLRDNSGNSGCSSIPEPVTVHVVNKSGTVVTELPKVTAATVSTAQVKAGEKFDVIVKIDAEGVGYLAKHIQNFNSSFLWEKRQDIGLEVGFPPKALGEGRFLYEVPVSKYRPSGKYTLNGCIYVRDNADNSGCIGLPPLLVEVINDGTTVDIGLPQIVAAKVSKLSVKPGESFDVIVRLVDSGSGFKPSDVQNLNSSFSWETNQEIGFEVGYPPFALPSGEFSYRVKVPAQRPSGKYSLNGCIYVRNNAGNSGCASLPEALTVTVTQ